MMYLIGGSPRSGKTTLAKRLSSRLRIGWVSADALESVVREYTPRKNYRKFFPKNILREKTHRSNDEMYEKYSAKEIVDAYIRQGRSSWKAVEAYVEDCIHEDHDFVIEGYQIHPKLVARLRGKFPNDIRAVFLVKKSIQSLMDGFQKNTAKNDWVLQKTRNKETFQKIAKMLFCFGKRIERGAGKYEFPVHCMDKNFLKTISSVEKKIATRTALTVAPQ